MTSPDNSSGIRPPVVSSPTDLPFRELDHDRFERLCQDVAKAHGFTDVHRYGRPGQPEHGVDFRATAPQGSLFAFQAKQTSAVTASQLRDAVTCFSNGPLAEGVHKFVLCMSVEANDRNFQNRLDKLRPQHPFKIEVWDSPHLTFLLQDQEPLVRKYFYQAWVDVFFGPDSAARNRLDAEALLLGPIEALGLTEKVQEAEALGKTSQADAARVYGEIADSLRDRFPGHADRFDQLSATALRESGDETGSHDLLMRLAIRDLFDRARPQLSSGVTQGIREVHKLVDETRQARGAAVIQFGWWHEERERLAEIAACFDGLDADDQYASYIAALLAEGALADRNPQLVLDRASKLREAGENGDGQVALRVRVALADAGVPGAWDALISQAEALRFPTAEGMYVCLRAGRWCAWNGQQDRAETLYRQAMKLGAEGNLDLDVENALWSLTAQYRYPTQLEEYSETNQLALSIGGTRSFVEANRRTQQLAYHYLANDQKPDAHLWSRFHLLESIRGGCLRDELESHSILAKIYVQSGSLVLALEHAVLSGETKMVKEIAPQLDAWPDFLTDVLKCPAPWVIQTALSALQHVGDLAPQDLAHGLVTSLLNRLHDAFYTKSTVPTLLLALGAIVLEATDEDIGRIMEVLEQFAPRLPNQLYTTDAGVLRLASRIYRFRTQFRERASSVIGEIAVGVNTSEWRHAIDECGDDTRELVETLERISEREQLDLAVPFSDLGHLNQATRARWSSRLQSVTSHPLGRRSRHGIGSNYEVPTDYLEEQPTEVVHQYVDKLVAIGSNSDEMCANRAAAFAAAADSAGLLSVDKKEQLSEQVRPFASEVIQISETDQFSAASLHPLNRFRISFGNVTEVRAAAGWLLGQAATNSEEYAEVVRIAVAWLRSEVPRLQRVGALLLTLPHVAARGVPISELATHANPSVRRLALQMPDMKTSPDAAVLAKLARDADRDVRIGVVYALPRLRKFDPDTYQGLRVRLCTDPSALVRALAAAVLESSD